MENMNIKPLSNLMGAEITGLDLNKVTDDETKKKLFETLKDYLVICIKQQKLSPEN